MTTGSVFMLQEVHLFLGRMILLPVVINTGFTTGKAASTGQVCIDFIIRNELADQGASASYRSDTHAKAYSTHTAVSE